MRRESGRQNGKEGEARRPAVLGVRDVPRVPLRAGPSCFHHVSRISTDDGMIGGDCICPSGAPIGPAALGAIGAAGDEGGSILCITPQRRRPTHAAATALNAASPKPGPGIQYRTIARPSRRRCGYARSTALPGRDRYASRFG